MSETKSMTATISVNNAVVYGLLAEQTRKEAQRKEEEKLKEGDKK